MPSSGSLIVRKLGRLRLAQILCHAAIPEKPERHEAARPDRTPALEQRLGVRLLNPVHEGLIGACGQSAEELKAITTQLIRLRDRLDAAAARANPPADKSLRT